MNKIIPVLCLMFAIAACGDDNPADSGQPVVDQSFDLPGGSLEDFRFTVDTDIQLNVILQGEFSVENGTVQMAVMGESEYQTWQEGGTPVVLYSPGETPGETFRLPIDDSDTYYIIFRNTGTTAVRVTAEIFLLSIAEQEL
jgi:hypothetical protein